MYRLFQSVLSLVLGGLASAGAMAVAGDKTPAPGISVHVEAQWQLTCGRSFIKQQVTISNRSAKALCVQPVSCGGNKLLKVTDQNGNRIGYGVSCGRTTQPLASLIQSLESIGSGSARSYYFGGKAARYATDDTEEAMSPSLKYLGSTSVLLVQCNELRNACANAACASETLKTWQRLEATGVFRRIELGDISISFAGAKSCPKGFDADAQDADPPGNPFSRAP